MSPVNLLKQQRQRAGIEDPHRGRREEMIMRSASSVVILAASLPAAASAAPPVSVPQACAPTYCIEVGATLPDRPVTIRVESTVPADASTTTVDMGRGFSIGFHSRYVEWKAGRMGLPPARWTPGKAKASAAACLKCGAPGWNEVMGIAMTGIPEDYGNDLSGISVCFWPLDRSPAGHGDGRTLRLGEKVCIADPVPRR
ncbi:hypothetical protein [Stenotrophomonas maltophilia]|uniref:hypothetical protein n=1 Tax=Stenotrophomonas maltophilia TaxID=40324 RepID=UPI0025536BF0|nr:hypothetical protein [Stenotrophomonas maltophilia]